MEVKALSVWEFAAAVDGWLVAHGPDDGRMSDAEQAAVWAKVEAKMGRMQ